MVSTNCVAASKSVSYSCGAVLTDCASRFCAAASRFMTSASSFAIASSSSTRLSSASRTCSSRRLCWASSAALSSCRCRFSVSSCWTFISRSSDSVNSSRWSLVGPRLPAFSRSCSTRRAAVICAFSSAKVSICERICSNWSMIICALRRCSTAICSRSSRRIAEMLIAASRLASAAEATTGAGAASATGFGSGEPSGPRTPSS